jgi:hypothetical protein
LATKISPGCTVKYVHSLKIHSYRSPSFQLSGHAHGLSGIYERISMAIRRLEDEKSALQKKVEELERDDHPTTEAQRLREENATLKAKLATTTKEKSEVSYERDVLLRKLNGVRQLVLDPVVRRASLRCVVPTFLRIPLLIPQLDDKATSDNAEPGLVSTTAARPLPRVLTVTSTQRTVSAPENFSSARTDISEPVTDVTVMLDTPGRAMRARPRTASARVGSVSQVLSSATLGEPFVDVRSSAYQDANGSPLLVRPASTFALNASPGMSEGLSVQYEDIPGSSASGASPNKTVKKWRLHFAKPPSAAEAMAIKPVTTSVLAERLELDEETVRFFLRFSLLLLLCWRSDSPP